MNDPLSTQDMLRLGLITIGAFGFAVTALQFYRQGVPVMDGMNLVMIAVLVIVGYALGRLWATPAKLVGLP